VIRYQEERVEGDWSAKMTARREDSLAANGIFDLRVISP
jgi:hypothetical protein